MNATNTKLPTTGIGAGPNSQGSIQGNVVEYMAYAASQGNGIVVQNWPNPRATYTTVQFNVVRYNGGNWNSGPGGPYGLYARESDYTLWQFNEEHHQQCWNAAFVMTSNVDNGGLDFDMGTAHAIAQYNYIHDNPMVNGAALLLIELPEHAFSPPRNKPGVTIRCAATFLKTIGAPWRCAVRVQPMVTTGSTTIRSCKTAR